MFVCLGMPYHLTKYFILYIWVWSRRCGCLVTWFCYQMIAKPGNKTSAPSWPDPYIKPYKLYISIPISLSLCNIWVSQWQCNVWFSQWQWSNPDGYWVKLANDKSQKSEQFVSYVQYSWTHCIVLWKMMKSWHRNTYMMTTKSLHSISTKGIPVSIKHAYIESGFISSDTRILMYHTWNITEDKVK